MVEHCLEIYKVPLKSLSHPEKDRRTVEKSLTLSSDKGFKKNELSASCSITFKEEMLVVLALALVVGGPLSLVMMNTYLLFFGSYTSFLKVLTITLFLSFHPMPKSESFKARLSSSYFTLALYRYFTYRFMWKDNAKSNGEIGFCDATIGAGPPHG